MKTISFFIFLLYNYLGDNMKKVFLAVIVFILFLFIIDINKFNNKLYKKIEQENIYIDEIYIYGRFLNIKGHADFNIENASLIFLNKNFEETKYNIITNQTNFYISDKINGGINLEKIIYDDYTLLLLLNDKYYSFNNRSNYDTTTYYTITKNNKTNYITFNFEEFKNKTFLKLNSVTKNTPNNIYDIVIDPGHGSSYDPGAVMNDIYESNINLSISLKLKEKLENEGFKVKLTREDDSNPNPYGKNGRATTPYEVKAKLFISVHINSTPYNLINGGVEVYASPFMDYTFAHNIASKIKEYANTTYSPMQIYKVEDGVYVRTFTESEIQNSKKEAEKNGYTYYENVTTNTPWYFYNRETGGYMTGAYIDGRNKTYPPNPYYNSNMGIEGYLLELGYITCKKDLDNLLNNQNGYVTGITKAIVEELK